MSENSKIQWTDHTFNPWRGCAKVSPGCTNCYAEVSTPVRIARAAGVETWGKDAARTPASEAMWRQPEKWNRWAEKSGVRARVFCASLADVFEDRKDLDPLRLRLFSLIRRTPMLDWQLLTKRPQNIRPLLRRAAYTADSRDHGIAEYADFATWLARWHSGLAPPGNVWLGVTVEDQHRADERIKWLLDTPAHVRFLSCEPLLGRVSLSYACFNGADAMGTLPGIDWVIVGGESGHGARACSTEWFESIIAECRRVEVPVFVKQLGGNALTPDGLVMIDARSLEQNDGFRLRDRKAGVPKEWPGHLRVRQFPEVRR